MEQIAWPELPSDGDNHTQQAVCPALLAGLPALCWGFPGFHHLLEKESKQGLTSKYPEPSSSAEAKSSSRNSPVAGLIT